MTIAQSRKWWCAALSANSLLFVAKLAAWAASGGSALLAEAIHSLADIGNQAMLRVGILKASEAPSAQFPYGHMRDKFIFRCVSEQSHVNHIQYVLALGVVDYTVDCRLRITQCRLITLSVALINRPAQARCGTFLVRESLSLHRQQILLCLLRRSCRANSGSCRLSLGQYVPEGFIC